MLKIFFDFVKVIFTKPTSSFAKGLMLNASVFKVLA
jgi:hypothetical protein